MIIKKELKRLNRDKIIILLPFWSDVKLNERIEEYTFSSIKSYIPNDFGYAYYEYSSDLLNSNPFLTRKYFNEFLLKRKRQKGVSYFCSESGWFICYDYLR